MPRAGSQSLLVAAQAGEVLVWLPEQTRDVIAPEDAAFLGL